MLDFLGFIATAVLMVLAVNAIITFMDVSQSAKLTLAGLAGLWIGIAAAAASAGMVAISKPFPVIGLFVAAPLVMAAIATHGRARAAMFSIPMPLMIGLNGGRVFAVLFLLLAAKGGLQVRSRTSPAGATSLPACLLSPWHGSPKMRQRDISTRSLHGTYSFKRATCQRPALTPNSMIIPCPRWFPSGIRKGTRCGLVVNTVAAPATVSGEPSASHTTGQPGSAPFLCDTRVAHLSVRSLT